MGEGESSETRFRGRNGQSRPVARLNFEPFPNFHIRIIAIPITARYHLSDAQKKLKPLKQQDLHLTNAVHPPK